MERSEPSLVPEWLKSSGNVTGTGTTTHPLSSSSLNSDDHSVSKLSRNKASVNSSDHDLGRSSPVPDRTSSSYFRRSSSNNGSAHLRSYSSFSRSPRGPKDWDKDLYESRDKDKSVFGELKPRDYLDPLENIYPSRFEKDGLRRSHSMISGKRGEGLSRRTSADSTGTGNDGIEGNGLLNKVGSIGSTHKAAFERDFPSLGSEERPSAPEIGRVPSPGLNTTIHGIPASAAIGGDKWISALAEVPAMVGSGGNGISSGQQTSVSGATSLTLSATTGLNMAEAVAQGPPRAHTSPQPSAGTQRLEELVIKQSRQLIPVTPSMPKPLVLNSSDKVKPKSGQQQHPTSSSLLSPSFRGGPVKTDVPKASNSGKLLVLKPARDRNGVAPAAKDSLSPTNNNSNKAANSPVAVAPPVSRSSSNNPLSPSAEWKHVSTMLEKKPTSQAQSRNDFFNLVRKKSMAASTSGPDPGPAPAPAPAVSPSIPCKASEEETVPAPATPQGRDVPLPDSPNGCKSFETKGSLSCNCDAFEEDRYPKNGMNHFSANPIFSEEEEAAFLRSLGWEENADEDGLTKEEIDAFLSKHSNSKLSLKVLQGVEQRLLLPLGSSQVGGVPSGLSSSDSKLEC